jgi:hypothetical protein
MTSMHQFVGYFLAKFWVFKVREGRLCVASLLQAEPVIVTMKDFWGFLCLL